MIGDANEWSDRFYLVPKEHREIGLVLVERSSVEHVFARPAFEYNRSGFIGMLKDFMGRADR
jgi:hypothetical protein